MIRSLSLMKRMRRSTLGACVPGGPYSVVTICQDVNQVVSLIHGVPIEHIVLFYKGPGYPPFLICVEYVFALL